MRYSEIDGCGVVLDIRSQQYCVFDECATLLWGYLTGRPGSCKTAGECARMFDAAAEQISESIDSFAADCLQRGFLRAAAPDRSVAVPNPGVPRGTTPGLIRLLPAWALALISLGASYLSLRYLGFEKTYRRSARIPSSGKVMRGSEPLGKVIRSFVRAENLVCSNDGPNDCLVRSLALYRYLRWCGIAATHQIGVRRVPFLAHAWVEVAGTGVMAPIPKGFQVLATLPY